MDTYAQIATKIIMAQELIIGPIAVEQARLIPHLQIDWNAHQVVIQGDEPGALDQLVNQYKTLFGQTSVEVCKEAAATLMRQLPATDLPQTLL